MRKLSKEGEYGEFEALVQWFISNPKLEIGFDMSEADYAKALNVVDPLIKILEKYQPQVSSKDKNFYLEFILWAMVENGKLDKSRMSDGLEFADNLLGNLIFQKLQFREMPMRGPQQGIFSSKNKRRIKYSVLEKLIFSQILYLIKTHFEIFIGLFIAGILLKQSLTCLNLAVVRESLYYMECFLKPKRF